MSDFQGRDLSGGGRLISGAATAIDGAAEPLTVLAAAAESAPAAWHVLASGGALLLYLPPGAAIPLEAGDSDFAWEVARSLVPTGIEPLRVAIAVAQGTALDAAAVVGPWDQPAAALAAGLATMPLPTLEEGPNAVWDRLGHAARRAQTLQKEGRIVAAALTFRGRGRLIGGLRGDLLIRFGVSAWR
ncbi:hypothetical protein sos41_27610 [Alphaproteobacteria bacterium SO-S41]|nr:hypothetical protein sos41_27610 [Alphaproteobacteria bacterium SO-S41]